MTFNAADRKDIRRLEKEAASAERRRLGVLHGIMDTTAGRQYIWEELAATHVFRTSYAPDTSQMAFLEGERNIGLRLLNDVLEACPDEFILMLRENHGREFARERPRGQDGDGDAGESSSADDSRDTGADDDDGGTTDE